MVPTPVADHSVLRPGVPPQLYFKVEELPYFGALVRTLYPEFNEKVPLMVVFVLGVKFFEMVKLLKVTVPDTVATASNTIVPVPALKVPLLVKLPDTVKVLEPPFKVAPELMVTLLATAPELTVG